MGRKNKAEDPKTVEQFVASASREVLWCRTLMHAWAEDKGRVDTSGGNYFWTMPCRRCGTVKIREISARGTLLSTAYKYPDGYQFHAGGKMDKYDLAMIRLAVVKEFTQ